MTTILRTTDLPVSADRAWAVVGKPESMSQWHPAIQSSQVQGTARTCVLPDGAQIHEEIRAHDDGARSYTYVITQSPLPVKDYASTIKVVSLDSGGSRLEWSCSYEPLAPAQEVESMIAGVYDAGLDALVQRFG
jgi:hypothetical protein